MRAYYFDNLPGDQRLPHECSPPRQVPLDHLPKLGVLHWTIPIDGHEDGLNKVAKERDYKNRDIINVTKEGLGEVSS